MPDLAVRVEHGHVQPRIAAAEPGGPQHGADLRRGETELSVGARESQAMWREVGRGVRIGPTHGNERVDAVQQARELDVRSGRGRDQIIREACDIAIDVAQVSYHPDPAGT